MTADSEELQAANEREQTMQPVLTAAAEHNLLQHMNGVKIDAPIEEHIEKRDGRSRRVRTGNRNVSATITVNSPEEFIQLVTDLSQLDFKFGWHSDGGTPDGFRSVSYRGDYGIKGRRFPEGDDSVGTIIPGDKDPLVLKDVIWAIHAANKFLPDKASDTITTDKETEYERIVEVPKFPMKIEVDQPVVERFLKLSGRLKESPPTQEKEAPEEITESWLHRLDGKQTGRGV